MPTQRQTNTAQRVKNKAQQVTNEDLAAGIKELGETLGNRLDKLEITVKTAGLNGHTELLKNFLDDRAMAIANRKRWMGRAKIAAAVVAFISSVGWAILAIRSVVQIVHPGS